MYWIYIFLEIFSVHQIFSNEKTLFLLIFSSRFQSVAITTVKWHEWLWIEIKRWGRDFVKGWKRKRERMKLGERESECKCSVKSSGRVSNPDFLSERWKREIEIERKKREWRKKDNPSYFDPFSRTMNLLTPSTCHRFQSLLSLFFFLSLMREESEKEKNKEKKVLKEIPFFRTWFITVLFYSFSPSSSFPFLLHFITLSSSLHPLIFSFSSYSFSPPASSFLLFFLFSLSSFSSLEWNWTLRNLRNSKEREKERKWRVKRYWW